MTGGKCIVVCLLHVLVQSQGCDLGDSLCSSAPQLQVAYNGVSIQHCNKELTKAETANVPVIKYPQGEGEAFLLVMSDPDAPRPCESHGKRFLHWLAVGKVIKGELFVSKDIFKYYRPSPPTDVHRYQFHLFPWISRKSDVLKITTRSGFSLESFIAKYHLGTPSAVFQFRVPAQN